MLTFVDNVLSAAQPWCENKLKCRHWRGLSLKFHSTHTNAPTHTRTVFHTVHTISQQVQEEIKLQHFSSSPPPLLLPASFFLKLMPARTALKTFLTCVCVCEREQEEEGGALITSQGTLISDGNIWFTLSWRDSCIKSRNYPNQFKLHPPPSLLHAAPLCI